MTTQFTISVLPLGQGQIIMCRMPGAVTDLVSDVEALLDLGPTAVLSLTPLQELTSAGGGGLPDFLDAHGVDWLHFPIGDFGTPTPAQQGDWETLSHDLHTRLDAGESVVVHCRAGLGRTGMIALRLMVERGDVPEHALSRLRDRRPGAIERQAQFEWAAQGSALR